MSQKTFLYHFAVYIGHCLGGFVYVLVGIHVLAGMHMRAHTHNVPMDITSTTLLALIRAHLCALLHDTDRQRRAYTDRHRQTQTDTDIERHRQTLTDTDRHRYTKTYKGTERHRHRKT